jgi:hypothetical protein
MHICCCRAFSHLCCCCCCWQGYELDVNGWEDAASMASLDCYKAWVQQDKPAYYTGEALLRLRWQPLCYRMTLLMHGGWW